MARPAAAPSGLLLSTPIPRQRTDPPDPSLLPFKPRYWFSSSSLLTSATKAFTACSASEPSALMDTSVPELIARLMMPMMHLGVYFFVILLHEDFGRKFIGFLYEKSSRPCVQAGFQTDDNGLLDHALFPLSRNIGRCSLAPHKRTFPFCGGHRSCSIITFLASD